MRSPMSSILMAVESQISFFKCDHAGAPVCSDTTGPACQPIKKTIGTVS